MSEGQIVTPTIKLIAEATIAEFPEGHDVPYTTILRTAYMKYRDSGPTNITIPGYAKLFIDGRKYCFEFDPKYAARKGYEKIKEGVWG